MKSSKLPLVLSILVSSIVVLSGCQLAPSSTGVEIPFVAANEIYKSSQLTPSERCEVARVDKRAACRKKLAEQTSDLTEAMKRKQ